MDHPGTRPIGRAVRQRLLGLLDTSAPLTIIESVPGCGKEALIRQRYEQLKGRCSEAAEGSQTPAVILIEFPQRALGDAQALGFAAGEFAEQLGVPRSAQSRLDSTLDALLRGKADFAQLERDLPKLISSVGGLQIFLVNYEWQASPVMDRLLVAAVSAGADVLCSLVDASDLCAAASVCGVATTIFSDDQLVFTPQEIGNLAVSFGIEPSEELIGRVHQLTAGHPLASSMLLLRALGIDRMVMSGTRVRVALGGVETDWQDAIDLSTPRDGGAPALRPVDVEAVTLPLLRSAVGMLTYAVIPFLEILSTSQGKSPFMRILDDLVTVPSIDLDALGSVLPGALRVVERLRDAGYAHIEYQPGSTGVVHWHQGMRAVLQDWLQSLPHDHRSDHASGFVMRMVSWYGEHGRPQEAAQLLQDHGDVEVLERFVSAHMIDLIWTRRVHGFLPILALPEAQRAQLPVVTVLAALETYQTIGQDEELSRRTLSIFPLLEERSRVGSVLQRLNSALSLCVGCAALEMWELHDDALLRCAEAVVEAGLAGVLERRAAGRANLIVGVLALIRGDLDLSKTLLLRVLAESDDQQGRPVALLCVRILEGYFGQALVSDAGEAEEVDTFADSSNRATWGSIDEFVALAQAWRAVWRGEPLQGLVRLRREVDRNGRLPNQPFFAWSYTLLLLIDGQAEAAYGVWQEVERLSGRDAPVGGRRLLGTTLAAFAAGRSAEAVALVGRHHEDISAQASLARALVAFSTGQQIDESQFFAGIDTAIVPRARTLLHLLIVGRRLEAGERADALARLRGIVASSSRADLEFGLRFCPKEDVEALRDQLSDELPSDVAELIARMAEVPHVLVAPKACPRLTQAERQVLTLLAEDLSNKAIAEQLFLSVNTVKSHVRAIYRKLEINSRAEAKAAAHMLLG